jgi:hypothetical protein
MLRLKTTIIAIDIEGWEYNESDVIRKEKPGIMK